MILTKEQILQERLPTQKLDIPWIEGGEIMIRALPNAVIDRAQRIEDGTGDQYIFVNAVIDESGKRLWVDEDAKTIGETVDRSLIEFVVMAAYKLSVIPEDRRKAIKKNSPIQATETSGESPSPSVTRTPISSSTT